MVCGHCHGQRIPEPQDSIVAILGQGDPYDAGEDLSRFYRPVLRDTHVGDFTFSPRFWLDGSPRLTAYEYQGILRSGCYREGDPARRINCLTCHTMHEGDPRGQLTGENRTDRPCLSCHTRYEARSSLEKHTRHRASSPGSRCYHCHMPRVVYGVMSVHPTHEITVPDPRLTAARAVPNACNQCHLDRSVNWSLREVRRLWPGRFPDATPSPDSSFDIPEGPRSLFAGDALTRALAAEAMGGGGPVRPDASWAAPFLVEALWDSYPIVRFFASNGLAAGGWGLPKVDYLAPLDSREALAVRWRERTRAQDPALRHQVETLPVALRATRREVDLEVGE